MTAESFQNVYEIAWSIFALIGGLYLIFFREHFARLNATALSRLYEKTKVSTFAQAGENFESAHMRLVVTLVGLLFIAAGVFTILERINILN